MPPLATDDRSGNSMPRTRSRNHARKRGERRNEHLAADSHGSEPDAPVDSEELFQLLGVNDDDKAPAQKGLIRLSKENMDAALGDNKKGRVRTKNKPRPDRPEDVNDPPTRTGPRRKAKDKASKKLDTPVSRESSPDGLDMTAMSRSLPASFFTENGKGARKPVPEVWDMPTDAGKTQDGMTWQQQLKAEEGTPSKSTRSKTAAGRRNAKATPGTTTAPSTGRRHDRRQSLDHVPVSNLTQMMANAGPPPSKFDASIPIPTGYNVHRAPQTPVRHAAAARSSPAGIPGAINLPIVGDFPRINKSGGPLGGMKYAGPTFHNSPASESLPKPDLDDF